MAIFVFCSSFSFPKHHRCGGVAKCSSPRTVEVVGRDSGRAACVSSVKIFSKVWLHSCLHKLYLLVNNCTFRCVSSGFDSDA